jgi:hypothetical protein
MSHAGFRVVASVGIMTLASACASQQKADGSTTVVEHRSASETAPGPERPPVVTPGSGQDHGSGTADAQVSGRRPSVGLPDSEILTPASRRSTERHFGGADCPMQMPDTRLTTLPAMGGVTFIFTTANAAARDELRRRAIALGDAFNRGVASPAEAATGPDPEATLQTNVEYLDEHDGAGIEVRAVHQNDIDELRRRLRMETTAMNDQRRCPALEGSPVEAESPSSR